MTALYIDVICKLKWKLICGLAVIAGSPTGSPGNEPTGANNLGFVVKRSKEDTAKTRTSIVEAASERFRKSGISETGLIDLMHAVGLTHGGFYRHFRSKDALVAEAVEDAFASTIEGMWNSAGGARKGKGLRAIAADYLAAEHRADRSDGCPLAALGSELARSDKGTRAVAAKGIQDMISTVAAQIGGAGVSNSEKAAMAAVATMFGALTMSRIVTDPKLSDALLSAARDYVNSLD